MQDIGLHLFVYAMQDIGLHLFVYAIFNCYNLNVMFGDCAVQLELS